MTKKKGKDGAGTYDYHDPDVDSTGHFWSDMQPTHSFGDACLEDQE